MVGSARPVPWRARGNVVIPIGLLDMSGLFSLPSDSSTMRSGVACPAAHPHSVHGFEIACVSRKSPPRAVRVGRWRSFVKGGNRVSVYGRELGHQGIVRDPANAMKVPRFSVQGVTSRRTAAARAGARQRRWAEHKKMATWTGGANTSIRSMITRAVSRHRTSRVCMGERAGSVQAAARATRHGYAATVTGRDGANRLRSPTIGRYRRNAVHSLTPGRPWAAR